MFIVTTKLQWRFTLTEKLFILTIIATMIIVDFESFITVLLFTIVLIGFSRLKGKSYD